MMPIPEQASTPWITTVLVSPSVSLANAGKAARITCAIDQKIASPTIESQITWLSQAACRLFRR